MGLRGPIPKSAEQRVYEGSAAHRPLPALRPVIAVGIPERPKGMTAGARKVWDAYSDQLASLGILRGVDAFALRRLCEDVAMLNELQVGMRQEAAERGRPERERRKQLRAIAAELKTSTDADRIKELRAQEAQLAAQREASSPLVALLMGGEAKGVAMEISRLANRIMRAEMQFGLTPVSSQRLEGGSGVPSMLPPPGSGSGAPSSIESALGG